MTVRFKIVLMHKVMRVYGSEVVFKMVPNLHILCSLHISLSLFFPIPKNADCFLSVFFSIINIVENVSPHLPVVFFRKPLASHVISSFVCMSRHHIS